MTSPVAGPGVLDEEPGPDPVLELSRWLPPNSDPIRPLMTLATLDEHGYPDARSVLLSEFGQLGLYFHTDARSRKAAQLRADPRACVTVVLPESARQLVIQGRTEPAPAAECAHAYGARPRYLQVLAWMNSDEVAGLPGPDRRDLWAIFERDHPDGTLLAPDTWAGFLLRPERITFWQGDPEGPSTRTEFRLGPSGWERRRLAG